MADGARVGCPVREIRRWAFEPRRDGGAVSAINSDISALEEPPEVLRIMYGPLESLVIVGYHLADLVDLLEHGQGFDVKVSGVEGAVGRARNAPYLVHVDR